MNPYRRRRPSITPYERPKWVLGGESLPWILKQGEQRIFLPTSIIKINVTP